MAHLYRKFNVEMSTDIDKLIRYDIGEEYSISICIQCIDISRNFPGYEKEKICTNNHDNCSMQRNAVYSV